MPQFDTIIFPRWVITVDDNNAVLENYAVVVNNGRIQAIKPAEEARRLDAAHIIELPEHALLPGFVNLHTHSAMTLLRGFADDLPLMDWLQNHIWPAEERLISDAFVHDGTLLGIAEMLRGGVTSFNDMYYFPEAIARAAIASGARAFVGCVIVESPCAYAKNVQEYLDKVIEMRDRFNGETRTTFVLAPHAPYTVSEESFRKINALAECEDLLIHCHIHETQDEIQQSIAATSERPLATLDRLGFLSSRVTAAHMVHLTHDEIELAAQKKISVAHNPRSNMKLGSGIAPIVELLNAGVNVGLGTDGAASNNSLDVLADTRLAALLAKVNGNPTALPASEALRMATINGAKALGVDDQIGSIEIGKEADMIAINLGCIEALPLFDPISQIIYATNREQIVHVWIAGEHVLDNRRLTKIDEAALVETASRWRTRVSQ